MYELSNLREEQKIHHPQDCTGNVHHGFCGGGARIVGFDPTPPSTQAYFCSYFCLVCGGWGCRKNPQFRRNDGDSREIRDSEILDVPLWRDRLEREVFPAMPLL